MNSNKHKQPKKYWHVVQLLLCFTRIQFSFSYVVSKNAPFDKSLIHSNNKQWRRRQWETTTTIHRLKSNSISHGLKLQSSVSPDYSTTSKEQKNSDSNSNSNKENLEIKPLRGKVNEIDFCIAPSDVSLSRSTTQEAETISNLSLTRALNDATNRAVRRILLSKSWPSAEALNRSLRMVLSSSKSKTPPTDEAVQVVGSAGGGGAKCPVPRPILNIITRRSKNRSGRNGSDIPKNKRVIRGDLLSSSPSKDNPVGMKRTEEQWVNDQLTAFRSTYGVIAGYSYAEAYLESILSLATRGVESARVKEVLQSGVYDEAYKRLLMVLRRAGVELKEDDALAGLKRIGETLSQQDICLSVMDKIQMKQGQPAATTAKPKPREEQPLMQEEKEVTPPSTTETKQFRLNLPFFFANSKPSAPSQTNTTSSQQEGTTQSNQPEEEELKPEDLGGVLLSSSEPSMTRQLNALSNIVQRTLLFGGDDEILVLAETLEADIIAFQLRWKLNSSAQPGFEYLSNLIQLLRNCQSQALVSNLEPPLPITSTSYANSYERLMANLVEGGSGYIKPKPNLSNEYFYNAMIPKNAQDEFGRFALWEVALRKKKKQPSFLNAPAYPSDLVGNWTVKDEIGGKIIGISNIGFLPGGQIQIYNTPSSSTANTGLRWRLDAGPTHLDTCTFQVISDDGAILQYKGFIDRGARLESRFSKRAITIRGAVTFLMRDASKVTDYADNIVGREEQLPIDFTTETTRFKMTKIVS